MATRHGKHQFCIKYYGFESEVEVEDALRWAFGEFMHGTSNGNKCHFEGIDELLGRKVYASIEGRSGGWLVIHEDLTPEEDGLLTAHVHASLKALPDFLKEERQYHADEKRAAEEEEASNRDSLVQDDRMRNVLRNLHEIADCDFHLVVKGIRVNWG